MFIARLRLGLTGLLLVLVASAASAQDTPTLTGSVSGSTINLSWTAVPGATRYELFAQYGGAAVGPISVGNLTGFSIPNAPVGSYVIAVRAGAGTITGPFSNQVTLVIGPPAPPSAPSGLSAIISGTAASISWNLNNPAGSLSGVQVRIATTPGGPPVVPIALGPTANFFSIPGAPPGTYYISVVAVGPGGASAPSEELILALPGCLAPATIPLNATSLGAFIQLSWPQLPGASGYRLDFASHSGGGNNLTSLNFPASQTSFSHYPIPDGVYYVTLHSALSCGETVQSAETVLNVVPLPRGPARSYAGAHGLLREAVIAMAAQYPGDLRNSCGNNTWMFRVLKYLRERDNRYGLNYKRGVIGDLSQDIIVYNHAEVRNEDATAPHLFGWDIISQHCGGNPTWFDGNVTNPNGQARWTIVEYLRAGYTP
jgi:hypothetical protein